ncbi:MAG: Coenzyme F420 hydrogenase/dehydrogenase, beta subunit C-terminal domain, partial [Clostridia bacterium]|nr:Coenzyme F420 hydrogenase/dehydrogenase, beta subunit C-terminal domain [Clostridia bacterium]
GLYSFLGKKYYDNLYVIDFICHGVPSPKVFASYINYLEEKYKDSVTSFKFRMTDKKWTPAGTQIGAGTMMKTKKGKVVRFCPGFMDAYMNGFLNDFYLRPSCYECEFKTLPKYYSDITIADFWGVHKIYPELNDGNGTSLLLINSEDGQRLFDEVKEGFHHKNVDLQLSIKKNPSLLKSAKLTATRESFFEDYKTKPFKRVMQKYMNPVVWGWNKIVKK